VKEEELNEMEKYNPDRSFSSINHTERMEEMLNFIESLRPTYISVKNIKK
jgi:hypothetical protein